MIWGTICWQSTSPMISLHGRINSQDKLEIFSNQVHLMVQVMFLERNAIFQDDNSPIIVKEEAINYNFVKFKISLVNIQHISLILSNT